MPPKAPQNLQRKMSQFKKESPLPFDNNQPYQVGEISELIHIIGGFLREDDDFQTMARMSVCCRMFKADLKDWTEEKKGTYRDIGPASEWTITKARAALVR